MKKIFHIALALSLLSGTAAMAQSNFQDRNDRGRNDQGRNDQGRNDQGRNDQGRTDQGRVGDGDQSRYENYRNNPGVRMSSPRFSRGDRLPDRYRQDRSYVVDDWQSRHLRRPPRGYHWVRDDDNNYFLAAITTGMILDLMLNSR
jgi:Ni/Co efflux regulator RcnB